MKEECTEETDNKIILFRENRSELIIQNNQRVTARKIKVDDCQITTGKRCDYLLIANTVEYFIELKGQDLKKALIQLSTTIKKLSIDWQKHKKVSFIICTRSPMNAASIQNERLKFKRDFGSDLIVKNSPHTYTLK